ncbi:MAG TPA: hypothetical protein VIM47_00900 [Dermatophilaceae bacterium]
MQTVIMTNPGLPGDERAVTTPEAFEQVWSGKGWELVQDSPADSPTPKTRPARKAAAPKPKPAQAPVTDPEIGA